MAFLSTKLLISFNCYVAYLSHLGSDEPPIYYGVWAFAELGLLILVGLDVWRYMKDPANQLPDAGKEAA